jgi:hypothetical protein
MDKNFYCNNEWFSTYLEAEMYANACLECDGKYFAVYTRLEMDSVVKGMVNSIINHAEECGK